MLHLFRKSGRFGPQIAEKVLHLFRKSGRFGGQIAQKVLHLFRKSGGLGVQIAQKVLHLCDVTSFAPLFSGAQKPSVRTLRVEMRMGCYKNRCLHLFLQKRCYIFPDLRKRCNIFWAKDVTSFPQLEVLHLSGVPPPRYNTPRCYRSSCAY